MIDGACHLVGIELVDERHEASGKGTTQDLGRAVALRVLLVEGPGSLGLQLTPGERTAHALDHGHVLQDMGKRIDRDRTQELVILLRRSDEVIRADGDVGIDDVKHIGKDV